MTDQRPFSVPTHHAVRVFAAAIAVVAWVGLALNFVDLYSRSGSIIGTLWSLMRFFTIITGLIVAVAFTGIAFRGAAFVAPKLMAGVGLAMLLVGVVYAILLQGLYVQTDIAVIADVLLHRVAPILVPLFWLVVTPKGRLHARDPFVWASYPLLYLAYSMVRGAFSHLYPYPFIDVDKIGWPQASLNALAIAFGFLIVGEVWVGLDRALGRQSLPAG